ncbi:hypothetical protein F0267_01230 [Vibrio coralliilyticus]|uniref:Uncharacterized protein n=2 Tax=Vibrio TaxID=662 RepID=A0AAN0SJH4_9VIBR|nr:hypothetical protein [Vibrio coralliilyticus]CAH1589119.1 conserved hypothetical protein [Vibrio jasicida]AIW22290.1 hypothetical protein IX92_24790 [Vibrio coralliilyticus]NOH36845.1 hypothetical protein [Vibrio coralliilyticus]PAW02364.1 hypothetical protein CKJ79_17020 [Vibrio coralliilyticus]CAH1599672.1 conserved hypothetical protein [Vibrio jasicida]
MSLSKVKNLFSRSQFPLHYGWLELIEKSIVASSDQEYLMSEINNISKRMGDEYTEALILLLDTQHESPYSLPLKLMPLKLSAKKRIATNSGEFAGDCEMIKALLSKHVSIGNKTPAEQRNEQRQIQEQKLQARREASEQMFKERKAQYERDYIDFPSIEVVKIRRRSKAANILELLTKGETISEIDYLWLISKGFENQYVSELYYLNRAELAKRKWEDTKKPWNLVNAIADYRKAGKPQIAVALVNKNLPFNFANGNKSLKSALLTTSGGAKRDLNMFDKAIQFGVQAHELTEQDYRPCTLIGACKMILGDVSQGHEWYQKAIKRGFNEDSFEQEIRSIYNRASRKDKAKIKQTLIADGWVYQWLK